MKIVINKTNISFITSDFPFSIKTPNVKFKDQMFYFPLTPQVMLRFIPKKKSKSFDDFEMFNEVFIDLFNHFVCERKLNPDFLLISNRKDILEQYRSCGLFKKDYEQLIETLKKNKTHL